MKKQTLILLVIVGIVIIIVVASSYQSQRSEPRPTAEEYFEISDATYRGSIKENGSLLILYELTFNLMAVGGPAHSVIVQNLGPDEPSPWRPAWVELGTMLQGEVRAVHLSTEYGLYIPLEDKGFPVRIRISSQETSRERQEQFIIINF